jgi:hypothetical protein
MFLCFKFSPRDPAAPPAADRIDGQRWTLEIVRSTDAGPWYPQLVGQQSETGYRFFAGRLAGQTVSRALPSFAPLVSAASDWNFSSGEPDGSWIALKFDRREDTLSIASDLFLLQRWYYACRGQTWFLANSLRFLHRCMGGCEIDWRGAPYILGWTYLPGKFTPLRDVFGLRSGEVLTIAQGRGEVTRRAELPVHPRAARAEDSKISAEIHSALRTAVAAEIAGAERLVLPLSGGIDSRFLLAFALSLIRAECVTTITFGHPSSLDFRIGTALARKLGVPSVALPMDERPVNVLLAENFDSAEGMYSAWPDYPVRPYREALPDQSLVLSGYIGDFVFGSYDLSDEERQAKVYADALVTHVEDAVVVCSRDVVRPLLTDGDLDPFRMLADLRARADSDWPSTCHRWTYENCLMNRTNFALEVHRDRAFYLAPYVHRGVLDVAYSLPPESRFRERAFFRALHDCEPSLYAFPATSNFGFPLGRRGPIPFLTRACRKSLNLVDQAVGEPWGKLLYHHPRGNYAHPRELSRPCHRAYVLECLTDLCEIPVFRRAALDDLRHRYMRNRITDWRILRGLLTLHQWLLHYQKP